jgi:hypothetical protein
MSLIEKEPGVKSPEGMAKGTRRSIGAAFCKNDCKAAAADVLVAITGTIG